MARFWTQMPRLPAIMTHNEYRANITGLNIFFGAVIGVVMAGTEALEPRDFTFVLFYSAGMVTAILYISASSNRILYAVLTAILAWLMPFILGLVLSPGAVVPDKLQPTLAVWVMMMVVIEFVPRSPPLEGALPSIPHPAEGEE